jgi:hypothetical protein
MDIEKSTRHQKIIGHFGEVILLNWLSRSGFEVCLVDHTGIDVIAYHPATMSRVGITVKSRTRNTGKENESVNLLSYQKGKDDRKKVMDACHFFACDPWLAVYVETAQSADLYLTSLAHYDEKYRAKEGRAIDKWKMGKKCTDEYDSDPAVKHVKITFDTTRWKWSF